MDGANLTMPSMSTTACSGRRDVNSWQIETSLSPLLVEGTVARGHLGGVGGRGVRYFALFPCGSADELISAPSIAELFDTWFMSQSCGAIVTIFGASIIGKLLTRTLGRVYK